MTLAETGNISLKGKSAYKGEKHKLSEENNEEPDLITFDKASHGKKRNFLK